MSADSVLSRPCERPRSLARAQMDRLKFDTPGNAAISLRVLAELARTGAVEVEVCRSKGALFLDVTERKP